MVAEGKGQEEAIVTLSLGDAHYCSSKSRSFGNNFFLAEIMIK
jgi:hypothetical protein